MKKRFLLIICVLMCFSVFAQTDWGESIDWKKGFYIYAAGTNLELNENQEIFLIYNYFYDDWKQFHNPKDLAISITLEAAELLEVFQWSGTDLSADKKLDKIKEELADVLIYSYLMANDLGLSIDEIVRHKLQSNDKKYPVEKAYGNSKKYTEL